MSIDRRFCFFSIYRFTPLFPIPPLFYTLIFLSLSCLRFEDKRERKKKRGEKRIEVYELGGKTVNGKETKTRLHFNSLLHLNHLTEVSRISLQTDETAPTLKPSSGISAKHENKCCFLF